MLLVFVLCYKIEAWLLLHVLAYKCATQPGCCVYICRVKTVIAANKKTRLDEAGLYIVI